MSKWQDTINKSPIDWLLETEDPSVRYLTLRDLLDREENDSEVEAAKAAIPTSKIIVKILSKQKPEGYWEEPENPYFPKYKSTYWQVMTLGQLGIEKTDQRVQRACEFIFNLQLEDGSFSVHTRESSVGLDKTMIVAGGKSPHELKVWSQSIIKEYELSCLTGNLASAFIRLGLEDDSRVKKALNWLIEIQNKDGGWLCPNWKAHVKDKHSCFHGTICALQAFSEVPEGKRTSEMKQIITSGAEFLLMHRLYKADHHNFGVINPKWLKFGFPYLWGYDVLRGLSVITKLGYTDDDRVKDALELLLHKRRSDGKWLLDKTSSKMQANIEYVGKPSKWITLNALKVFKRLNQTSNKQLRAVLARV